MKQMISANLYEDRKRIHLRAWDSDMPQDASHGIVNAILGWRSIPVYDTACESNEALQLSVKSGMSQLACGEIIVDAKNVCQGSIADCEVGNLS